MERHPCAVEGDKRSYRFAPDGIQMVQMRTPWRKKWDPARTYGSFSEMDYREMETFFTNIIFIRSEITRKLMTESLTISLSARQIIDYVDNLDIELMKYVFLSIWWNITRRSNAYTLFALSEVYIIIRYNAMTEALVRLLDVHRSPGKLYKSYFGLFLITWIYVFCWTLISMVNTLWNIEPNYTSRGLYDAKPEVQKIINGQEGYTPLGIYRHHLPFTPTMRDINQRMLWRQILNKFSERNFGSSHSRKMFQIKIQGPVIQRIKAEDRINFLSNGIVKLGQQVPNFLQHAYIAVCQWLHKRRLPTLISDGISSKNRCVRNVCFHCGTDITLWVNEEEDNSDQVYCGMCAVIRSVRNDGIKIHNGNLCGSCNLEVHNDVSNVSPVFFSKQDENRVKRELPYHYRLVKHGRTVIQKTIKRKFLSNGYARKLLEVRLHHKENLTELYCSTNKGYINNERLRLSPDDHVPPGEQYSLREPPDYADAFQEVYCPESFNQHIRGANSRFVQAVATRIRPSGNRPNMAPRNRH